MIDKEEIQRIRIFTTKSETDKAFRTLEGILRGIAFDKNINIREIHELKNWCGSHINLINKHPFNEAIPMIMNFIDDNEMDQEEYEDLIWLTESITGNSIYYNAITGDLQVLQGIIHGILADNIITENEVRSLNQWITSNNQLSGTFPYDELSSLLNNILADNKITTEEIKILKAFFSDFIPNNDTTINIAELQKIKNEMHIGGICAMNPILEFNNRVFCFTGASERAKRNEIEEIIYSKGGKFSNNVSRNLNYLIVGNAGNPCWAFSCYGRKVEQAISLRKEGNSLLIINETDFWKAL